MSYFFKISSFNRNIPKESRCVPVKCIKYLYWISLSINVAPEDLYELAKNEKLNSFLCISDIIYIIFVQ